MSNGTSTARRNRRKVARAMDIRTVIGDLLALYGAILTITGLVRTITGLVRGADARADVWAGICLLIAGAAFLLWVKVRPIEVPEDLSKADAGKHEES